MLRDTISRIWAALLALTLLSVAVGELGLVDGLRRWPVPLLFALVLLKARWVALHFMELAEAPPLWRRLLLGWLYLVLSLILLAWWLALPG